jgi:hypothetical protein
MSGFPSKIAYSSVTLFCLLGTLLASQEAPARGPYPVVSAKEGERCSVCGAALGEDDVALMVRGRRVLFEKSMIDTFLADPEKYFSEKQPRAGLFQEELDAPPGTAQGGISWGWFLFGSYVLLSLLFAGLSGYSAISKGLQPIPSFFIGLFFNALGCLYVLTRRRVAPRGNLPAGLVKIPVTLAPKACPTCGNTNHPAARKCSVCDGHLQPGLQSDVARASGSFRESESSEDR